VPQGSSLGPLLFLIYITDLSNTLNSKPTLFADDTCLTVQANTPETLQIKINDEIEILNVWCCAIKLTINPAKSPALILSPKLQRTEPPSKQLYIVSAGVPVKIVDHVKYLGIKIDSKLNFQEHIKTLEGKVACSIGMLSILK